MLAFELQHVGHLFAFWYVGLRLCSYLIGLRDVTLQA